jgi:hypothetical protein
VRGQCQPHRVGLRSHRQHDAEITNQRSNDVTAPTLRIALIGSSTAQAQGRCVNGFLAQRAKTFTLKRRVAVSHLGAGEEQLEPVVGGAGEHHAAENLPAFGRGEGCLDGRATQEPVACVEQLFDGGTPSRRCGDSRGCVRQIGWMLEKTTKLLGKRDAKRIKAVVIPRVSAVDGFERGQGLRVREWMPLEHEGAEQRSVHRASTTDRTNASISAAGRAPAVRPRSRPPANTAIVGIDRMPKRSPSSDTASVFTLTTSRRPACRSAIFSNSGATMRHGPHHGAQ